MMTIKIMKMSTIAIGGILLILFIYIISSACVEGFSKEETEVIQQVRAARALADNADKQWQKMLDEVK